MIIIMGVSGSGKTSLGKQLSLRMSKPFYDADDFHTTANKNKMKSGHVVNRFRQGSMALRLSN